MSYDFDTTAREWGYTMQTLNQQDLDRNFALATTHIVKWMQAARMDMPWLGAGYKNLNQLEPPLERRLLVGSQMVRCASPGILTQAVGNEVVTQCEVGSIGNTSMEFRYRILFGDQEVATGCALMICVGGTPGNLKPSPVPDDIRGLAAEGGGEDKAFMQSALKECPADAPDDAFSMPLIIRHSDEDLNKHANHSAYCRFFEDAKEVLMVDEAAPAELRNIAERYLDTIIVAYQAEARALDVCEIKVSTSAESTLDIWIYRTDTNSNGDEPGLVTRGRLITGGDVVEPDHSELLRNQGSSKL